MNAHAQHVDNSLERAKGRAGSVAALLGRPVADIEAELARHVKRGSDPEVVLDWMVLSSVS
jgi:hypothetical protein